MPFAIQGTVEGMGATLQRLKALRGRGRTIQRNALRKAGRLVRQSAREHLDAQMDQSDESSGLLRRSLWVIVKTYGNSVMAIIGPKTGMKQEVAGRNKKKRLEDPAKIAHLVEFGTQPHALGKGASLRKKIQHGDMHPGAQAKPFMRPAWDETQAQVRGLIEREVAAGLEKEAARAAA
jgi:HK97 gp10 family phage protein